MAYCITKAMGMERIKARAHEWLAAMSAGRDAAPRCDAKTSAGKPCQSPRMRGADRCRLHVGGSQRDIIDAQRAKLAERMVRSTNAKLRAQGEAALRSIAKRRLHRAWQADPTLPGSTLTLPDHDEARVRRWLLEEHGIDLDKTTHEGGFPLSYRAIDRLRWAAALCLTKRSPPPNAAKRVVAALRDDLKWWRKHHGEPTP
jgi:hypothetical protein